ncbi:MAG: hypothetical protein MI919_16585 [Holophagales bacterium]|nr:hypothetical protein [Holophagales bacterium]
MFERNEPSGGGGADAWGQVAKLTASDTAAGDEFGASVSVSGDTVVVGASRDDDREPDSGSVYVFERNVGGADAWGQVAKLTASDAAAGDEFGYSVAVSGDTVVVSALFDSHAGFASGSAYVFERNEGGADAWGQTAKLTASDAAAGDYFGWAVAVEGDVIFVGAHYDDSPAFNAGSVYLYRRDEGGPGAWGEVEKFTSDLQGASDDFGIALDLDSGTLLVGADLDDQAASAAGAAYIFELTASTDLSISIGSSPNPVPPGGSVTYTVEVQNLGAEAATGVVVSHLFGPGSGAGSTTSGCAEDPAGIGNCTLGTVAAGATVQYTLTRPVDAGASGSLSFTAAVASDLVDPSAGNDSATVSVVVGGGGGGSADLSILMQDSADPVAPGSSLTYTLVVLNNGPGEAVNAVLTPSLPPGVANPATSGCAEDPAGIPSCTVGNIQPSSSAVVSLSVDVVAASGETLVNQVVVSSDSGDDNPTNNSASETTAVGAGSAELSIFMEEDVDPIQAGDTLTYTIEVLNNGPDPAAEVVVVPTLPAGATVPSTAGCTEDPAGAASCSLGTIAAGSSKQFTLTVLTDPAEVGTLNASAEVTSSALDPIPANNVTNEATTVSAPGDTDLFVLQTDSVDPVEAGGMLEYRIIVGNRGPSTAQGVMLTDIVPPGAIDPRSSGCAEDPGGIPACSLGSIGANMTKAVTITLGVPVGFSGTLVNEVSVAAANPELDPSDNSASETTTVEGQPGMADLFLSIEEAADPVNAGDTVSYEISVLNLGPHQVSDAAITSVLPPGLSNPITSGCAEDPGGLPTCTLGVIGVSALRTITVTADVDPTAVGIVTFEASASSSFEDSVPANNSDSETTEILGIGLANLAVSFTGAPATAAPGSTATYTVTVENLGPDAADPVQVESVVAGAVGTATTSGCAEDPGGLPSCTLGTLAAPAAAAGPLAAGSTASFTVELPVAADATGTIELTATVSSPVEDSDTSGNTVVATTRIDADPPTVTTVHSVGDTGGGSLEECEEARVELTDLLVSFSEAMHDPAGDSEPSDVTNPINYQLVSAGPDHDLATDLCGPAQADDELVPLVAVTYDPDSLTATLRLGSALADAPYRLLVCDTLADAAGIGLDGSGNGSAGGDFGRYFRVHLHNLFADGHFDCGLDSWARVATSPKTEITHTSFDHDGAQISGAAVIYNNAFTTEFSVAQCVPVERQGNYQLSGEIWVRDLEAELTVSKVCELFADEGCLGLPFVTESSSEVFTAGSSSWAPLDPARFAAEGGTRSALCSVDLLLADGNAEITVMLDELVLTDSIFAGSFEGGDLSGWASTSGE